MTDEPIAPTPGSDAAVAQGCLCPVLDNAHGRGAGLYGPDAFWINGNCPLHGGHTVQEGECDG